MKKWGSLLLMLVLLLPAQASAAVAVNGLCTALIGEDGSVLVEPGLYDQIIFLTDGLFAAGREGTYCLLGADGAVLTDNGYAYFEAEGEYILFERDGKYGVMDRALETVVPNEYTWIVQNGEGGFLALRSDIWDGLPDGVYRIEAGGRVTPTGVKVSFYLSGFSDGLSPAISTDKGRCGYLNPQGQWAIQPQFNYASGFADGLAMAVLDSGWGVLDTSGAWRISPKYDLIASLQGDRIIGLNEGKNADVYDRTSFRIVFTYQAQSPDAFFVSDNGWLIVYEPENVLILNGEGEIALVRCADATVEAAYSDHFIIREGENGDEVTCVNAHGETVTGVYQDMEPFDETENGIRLLVRRFERDERGNSDVSSVRCGLIDISGRELLPLEYSDITTPAPGWVQAEKDGQVELYAPDGTLVWSYKL